MSFHVTNEGITHGIHASIVCHVLNIHTAAVKFPKRNKLAKIIAIKTVMVPHQVKVRAKVMVFTLTLK